MPLPTAYWWNKVPFVRLLICLAAGIILQWFLQFSFGLLLSVAAAGFTGIIIYSILPVKDKYKFSFTGGTFINLLIAAAGAILVWLHDVRHNTNWIGHHYKDSSYVVLTLEEPLVEKTNSYKALASVQGLYKGNHLETADGKIILYFKKDPAILRLHYGSQIIFKKPLQEIKNAGNPGSFDYNRYSLFQGITHQVYLLPNDFEVLPAENKNAFTEFIFNCRSWVIATLRKYIPGGKEQGLAEALLIGYKDDLDKNLVESYSNTGVVHVIAISGLHLGLIYWLLLGITRPLKKTRKLAVIRLLIIISSLWLFSILAGAQPSVLRSAVMFSFIAWGQVLQRSSSIYNTLALSAFALLCYNPYWLWDVGFQLSYAAVLSIIIFFKPIYNWLYFPNKILDFLWKLNAVTIAAQLLTLPISIYHFHQVPTLFLFTNLVAVPLSSIILIGEIVLCALFFIEPVAKLLGMALEWMIWLMNSYIERFDSVSFSLWNGLSTSIFQTVLLLCFVILFCFWLMQKNTKLLWVSLFCLLGLITIRTFSFIEINNQKKLIVYNVPKHTAIDIVTGRNYNFIGDSGLLFDDFLRNFHIQPSRVLHRMEMTPTNFKGVKEFEFFNKKITIIDSAIQFIPANSKSHIDILILSKNPKLYISNLIKTFSIGRVIIDGSVPPWKARLWKKDCDSLHIPYYDVSEKGAFVMNL